MMVKVIKQLSFIIASIFIGFLTADSILYQDLKDLLNSLQQVSSAVFALAGIWIAYLYPEALTSLMHPKKVSLLKGSKNTKRIESLVLIIISSAIVLITTLFFDLFYIIKMALNLSYIQNYSIKVSGISIVAFLSFIQVNSISSILVANISFVNELHNIKEDAQANDDL